MKKIKCKFLAAHQWCHHTEARAFATAIQAKLAKLRNDILTLIYSLERLYYKVRIKTVFTWEKSTGSHEGGLDDLDLLDPVELGLVHQLVELGDDVVEDVQRLRRLLVREEGSELWQAERNFRHNMILKAYQLYLVQIFP